MHLQFSSTPVFDGELKSVCLTITLQCLGRSFCSLIDDFVSLTYLQVGLNEVEKLPKLDDARQCNKFNKTRTVTV